MSFFILYRDRRRSDNGSSGVCYHTGYRACAAVFAQVFELIKTCIVPREGKTARILSMTPLNLIVMSSQDSVQFIYFVERIKIPRFRRDVRNYCSNVNCYGTLRRLENIYSEIFRFVKGK